MGTYALIVSSRYYAGEKLANLLREKLPDAEINVAYRDYNAVAMAADADLIIGDGTCKTRDETGVSIPIRYSSRELAKEHNKPYLSMRRASARRVARALKSGK